MPTNPEVLKSIDTYLKDNKEKIPVWIATAFRDQPNTEYDTPEENAYSAGLQDLDKQSLNPIDVENTLSAMDKTGLNRSAFGKAAGIRSGLAGIADAASKVPGVLSFAYSMMDPAGKANERNTEKSIEFAMQWDEVSKSGLYGKEQLASLPQAMAMEQPDVYGAPASKPGPVGNIPMSQHEEQADRSRQQSEAAAAAAAAAQSNKESNKAGTSGIGDFGGKSGSTGGLSGGQGDSPGGSGSDSAGSDSDSGSEGPGGGAGADSAGSDSASGAEGPGWNTGGRIGALIQHLQTGGDVENADTNMEVANVPMGVVDDADGAPSPFSGGTGVEDDLDMDVEAGSYVLNAESVQLIGISDINAVIRDAYSIAAALGKEVPADYDPQNKVPIRISNGEAIIPKALVEIIGLDKLEKWNKKGLQLRQQKEKMMAEQQQQPPQEPQVAAEAPMQQQMGQLMAKGGEASYNVLSGKEELPEEMVEIGEKVLRGVGVDLGIAGAYNIGFDQYDEESTLKAADLAGSLLGNSKKDKIKFTNLLRRTAAAESDLGTDSNINRGHTYKANKPKEKQEVFTIGPFQVTKLALDEVKKRVNYTGMKKNIAKIKQHKRFKNVDFSKIDVDDLKDPYINAVIARLYYTTFTEPVPDSLPKQAAYWKKYYNTPAGAGTAKHFIKKANKHNL